MAELGERYREKYFERRLGELGMVAYEREIVY